MIPGKTTLSNLKSEIHANAVRLFIDACSLFRARSYSSAYALAILSFEEIGKLEMVDHICDDIVINPQCNPNDFLEQLFSRHMILNHKNKQMWATLSLDTIQKKRRENVASGNLERAKQNALYVGYFKSRISSPKSITANKARSELRIVHNKLRDIGDLGFNGFYCLSDARSRAKAKRLFARVEKACKIIVKQK